jgi:hypothetical protein
MHGSLNWVFRTRDQYPVADFMRAGRELQPWTNTQPSPDAEQVRTGGSGRSNWYLWPLVVPPIYEKHGCIHGRLREVWTESRRALVAADRVIFWGYSFPAADLHARYLFQAISQENDALRRPALVNPDPQSLVALWDVLRPDFVEHFADVTAYLGR